MSVWADESYSVYNETFPRARIPHRCDACKEVIPAGHRYARIGTVFDGSAESVKRCLRCQEMHEHLRKLCWASDESEWPDERLNCGHGYSEVWGTEPPPEVARLAFMLPGELEAELQQKRAGGAL
jgi:hypothetical protein